MPNLTRREKPSQRQHRPRIALALVAAVIVLQATLLLTLTLTTRWEPPQIRVVESLWVWLHTVANVPLVMLLVGGPVLTWLAMSMDARKTLPLFTAWAVFGVTLVACFGSQTQWMLVSLWNQATAMV